MRLEDYEDYKILSRKQKYKAKQILQFREAIVKCMFCDLRFHNYSDSYNAHLLFFHSFLMPTCSSPTSKRLVDNVLAGMQIRDSRKLEKSTIKIKRRNGMLHLWQSGLRLFFTQINNMIPPINEGYIDIYTGINQENLK